MNLKSIAKKAGVSTATVSNVINGNYHKVSKKTIDKVQKIIEETDYQPNATARSLAMKESKIIGVVIPNVGNDEAFSASPYNTEILALLENYIRSQGYYMMMRCVESCAEIIPIFSTWNVDGIVIFGAHKEEVADIQRRLDVPSVYIDAYTEGMEITNIGIDDYKGGLLAARYLLGKGHRKIAFVGPNVNSSGVINERYKGFCVACDEKNVEITPEHIFEAYTNFEQGVAVGKKIAFSDIPFTAVATMSDILAFGVMEGLRLSGKSVPADISIIGFDNLPECCYSNPQLTTVSQNMEQKAMLAGKYLFEMIQNRELIFANEVVDVEIVERQSVKEITL